jgi:hypothetical protein
MLNISSNNINLFNIKLIEFFDFLEKVVNDVYAKKTIKKNANKIKLGIKLNSNIIINIFYEKIYNYKNEINNENESVLEIFQINLFDNKLDLKNIWKTINESDRETIWKYLQIFVLLCEQ